VELVPQLPLVHVEVELVATALRPNGPASAKPESIATSATATIAVKVTFRRMYHPP
jgi:hypothetical protein